MIFRDGHEIRRSINLACRSVYQATAASPKNRFEHVERSSNVGIDERLGCLIAIGNRDEGCEVEHDVDLFARGLYEPGISDIPEANFEGVPEFGAGLIEPSQRAVRVVEAECPYRRSFSSERFD